MKNFTDSQMQTLVSQFFLVHTPIQRYDISLYNKSFIYKSGYSPFITCFMMPEHLSNISLDKLEKINLPNKKGDFYLLPNLINYSGYTDSVEQRKILEQWISLSQTAKEIYLNNHDQSNVNEQFSDVIGTLLNEEVKLSAKAKQLWNTITLESKDINKASDPTTPEFWEYYKNSSFYSDNMPELSIKTKDRKVTEKERKKQFMECIINCFESYDDILKFEDTIENTKLYTTKELQYEIWTKLMKKFVPYNSLEVFSPLLKQAYNALKMHKNSTAEFKLKNLKVLEYMNYELVKDVYFEHHNKPMTAGVADYTKKILDKYDSFKIDDDTAIIKSSSYELYHHAQVELNMNVCKRSINHKESLERLINLIGYCFKSKETDIVNFTYSVVKEQSFFKLDSHSEHKARSLEKDLAPYLLVALSPEFLTKETLEGLKDKNFYTKDQNSEKPSIALLFAKRLSTMALTKKLEKGLDNTPTMNQRKKI